MEHISSIKYIKSPWVRVIKVHSGGGIHPWFTQSVWYQTAVNAHHLKRFDSWNQGVTEIDKGISLVRHFGQHVMHELILFISFPKKSPTNV